MTIFPCAKLNLGLNVVSRRSDGYHDLETVFYPIPLHDALEICEMDDDFPSALDCDIKVTGIDIQSNDEDNLVTRAYRLLAADYQLPRLHVHLHKGIPSQAGLGGGSSDAANMITLLNAQYHLGMEMEKMEQYAARLGADCAFFIRSHPAYAQGIGDLLEPLPDGVPSLKDYYLALVKPDIAVSTKEAYGNIHPRQPEWCCRDVVSQPIETWSGQLCNDFEKPIFSIYPEIGFIKQCLYDMGAVYAQMSGSGSSVFGIFEEDPAAVKDTFSHHFTAVMKL